MEVPLPVLLPVPVGVPVGEGVAVEVPVVVAEELGVLLGVEPVVSVVVGLWEREGVGVALCGETRAHRAPAPLGILKFSGADTPELVA